MTHTDTTVTPITTKQEGHDRAAEVVSLQSASALPCAPDLPTSAPTLAKHLAWALNFIRNHVDADHQGFQPQYMDALAALCALPELPAPTAEVAGQTYWHEDDGGLMPDHMVPATKKLVDQTVRTIALAALHLNGSLARFKAASMADVVATLQLLAEQYGAPVDPKAPNVTLYSHDKSLKVLVSRPDRFTFGPEVSVAGSLLKEWLANEEASPAVRAVVERAFGLDQDGKLRPAELFRLLSYEVPGDTWANAMKALRDSITVIGKAEYLRVYRRTPDGKYALLSLDLASV